MLAQIAEQLHELSEQTEQQQPTQTNQVANLQVRDQELAGIIKAEFSQQTQVSVLWQMHH